MGPPDVLIEQADASEDEFYDALENTQALNEAQEKEVLNSPTLQRVERFYHQSGSAREQSPAYSPAN